MPVISLGGAIVGAQNDAPPPAVRGAIVGAIVGATVGRRVAGAVTGGGLTIIANAPNPAGVAILRRYFDEGAVSPTGLLVSALLPTLVALLAFRYL